MYKYILCLLIGSGFVFSLFGQHEASLGNPAIFKSKSGEILPPDLREPLYNSIDDILVFNWKPAMLADEYEVEYEFLLYHSDEYEKGDRGKTVFHTTSLEPEIKIEHFTENIVGPYVFVAVVNMRISDGDKSYVVEGYEKGRSFTIIPDCTTPKDFRVAEAGENYVRLEWTGAPASADGIHYTLQYRMNGSERRNWEEIIITSGTSVILEGLMPTFSYDFLLKKLCHNEYENTRLESKWVELRDIIMLGEHPISLPAFDCGDPYDTGECEEEFTGTLENGDTIYIGGFPVLLDSLWNDTIEGQPQLALTGYVPLPFGIENVVKVELENITFIDTKKNVCNYGATATAYRKSPASFDYDIFNPLPAQFGGEICIPPPSESEWNENGINRVTGELYDENGFSQDGSYIIEPPFPGWEDGDPVDTTGIFDPWGFNANGVHRETGLVTNPNGCTREQLLSQPQAPPCDELPPPYYWLNQDPPTQSGISFANQVKDTLDEMIIRLLEDMRDFYMDSLNNQESVCEEIRDTMEVLIDRLDYERIFIFGENDKFFEEGMHENFAREPKPLGIHIDRLPDEEKLELKHVELYQCDKNHAKFQRFKDIIIQILASDVPDLKADLLEDIKRLSVEEVNNFINNPSGFEEWVKEYLKNKVQVEYNLQYGTSSLDFHKDYENIGFNKPNRIESAVYDPGNMMAEMDNDELSRAFAQSLAMTPEDVIFQYRQGWKYINGVHRAYYMDYFSKQRKRLKIENGNSLINSDDEYSTPIEVTNRADDGRIYTIYLDNIVFTPQGATLDAFMLLEIPRNSQKILFLAENLTFHPTGVGAQPVKLSLQNDVQIRLSNALRLNVKGSDDTFVSFDCDGFAGIGIDAEIEVCREYLIPIDTLTGDTLSDIDERVSADFKVTMSSWGDFYLSLVLDPFVVRGAEDIKWLVDTVVFDFSEVQSPTGQTPEGYTHPFVNGSTFTPLWQGFYLSQLEVRLPKQFVEDGDLVVSANNIIIDDLGFSGSVSGSNILDLEDGNAGGWAFSVDELSVTILHNQLKTADIQGLIHVPIFSAANGCNTGATVEEDCFQYSGFIELGNKYHFSVTMGENDFCVDMWKAGQIILRNNSGIEMLYQNDKFEIVATLHGEVEIRHDFGSGLNINIPNIKFEDVRLQNTAPYFDPGKWKFPTDIGAEIGGFGISISDIRMVKEEGSDAEAALAFRLALRLTDTDNIDLAAAGRFRLIGEVVKPDGSRQRWKFKNIKVEELELEGSFPGVESIYGKLSFYDHDDTFGNGFRGIVKVKFRAFGLGLGIDALGQFGKKDNAGGQYKYFLVDLMAHLEPGINFSGAFKLIGIGGGAYYNMTRDSTTMNSLPSSPTDTPELAGLGVSLSGIQYVPEYDAGLGIKATIAISTEATEQAFNANATFEIQFNNGGGLKKLWIYGNGKFMDDVDIGGSSNYNLGSNPNNGASVSANVDIEMKFAGGFELDGKLEVYVDVAGVLTGEGVAEVYAGANGWFLNVGTPSKPVKINATVAGIDLLTLTAYMDIGTNIPPMPELPYYVRSLTGLGNFLANESSRATGRGFAFGASLSFDTGRRNFPCKCFPVYFYGEIEAGAGFDFMLQDFGDARCQGSNDRIGINGWYAAGQSWAYFRGVVGVGAKVWGKSKEFDVIDLSAAAALQMKLPNPFVAKGAVGGRYRLLGGLIKGSINFKFTIGESCQIVGGSDPIADLDLILNTQPIENGVVAVDLKPTVGFNIPIGTDFPLNDIEGNQVVYRAKLNYAQILHNGLALAAKYEWKDENSLLEIYPKNMLVANDSFLLKVSVTLYDGSTVIKTEERTIPFKTAGRHTTIPDNNILYTYPMDGQFNYYKLEKDDEKGYIQLLSGQPDLFEANTLHKQIVRITPSGGSSFETGVTYNEENNLIEFGLPAGSLQNNTIYRLQLLDITNTQTGSSNNTGSRPVDPVNPSQSGPGEGVNGPGGYNTPSERVLYESYFRTSEFNTFYEKIEALSTALDMHKSGWEIMGETGIEPFDMFELVGFGDTEPLMQMEALLNNTPWYTQNKLGVDFYDNYSTCDAFRHMCIDGRDKEILGAPPKKAVLIEQSDSMLIRIRKTNYNLTHIPQSFTNSVQTLKYAVPKVIQADYEEIRSDIVEYELKFIVPELNRHENRNICRSGGNLMPLCECSHAKYLFPYNSYDIYCTDFPSLTNTAYPVTFTYRLPGTGRVTSVKAVNITY